MNTPGIYAAQYRLAQHYLNRLREAAEAVRRGRANLSYGLQLFDQDWANIQQWQAWAAKPGPDAGERAWLCKEFPFAGAEAMSLRMMPPERLTWWQAALDAARQLHDRQAEIAILPKLAMAHSALGELHHAEDCARQLLLLAEESRDQRRTGQALYLLGTILEDRANSVEAVRYYQRALAIFTECGSDIDRGRALLGLGSVAIYSADYQNAYEYFMQYLKLVETGGREVDLCIALQAVGEALRFLNRSAEAESCFQRSVRLCRTLHYGAALGPCLVALGSCVMERGDLEAARQHLEEGVEVSRAFGARRDVVHGLHSLGGVLLQQGKYDEARRHLQEGLELACGTGLTRYCCNLNRRMAEIDLAFNQLDDARERLLQALLLAQEVGLHPEKVKCIAGAVALASASGCQGDRQRRAAVWAGRITRDPEHESPFFGRVCSQLETVLGTEGYREALQQGQSRSLDEVFAEALEFCAHPL